MDLLNLVTLGHGPSSVTPPLGSCKISVLINPQHVLKNKVSICSGIFWEEVHCFQELLKDTVKKMLWNSNNWAQMRLLHHTVNVSFAVCTGPFNRVVSGHPTWINNLQNIVDLLFIGHILPLFNISGF